MTATVCFAGRTGTARYETFCGPAPGPRDLLSLLRQIVQDRCRRQM